MVSNFNLNSSDKLPVSLFREDSSFYFTSELPILIFPNTLFGSVSIISSMAGDICCDSQQLCSTPVWLTIYTPCLHLRRFHRVTSQAPRYLVSYLYSFRPLFKVIHLYFVFYYLLLQRCGYPWLFNRIYVININLSLRPTSLAWGERKTSPARPIMLRVLADLDLSPPTLVTGDPSTSVSASHADALAWGSDEEDLLNDDDDGAEDEDAKHFDEAIKSVASTERLLRCELGREQASLRQLDSKKNSSTSLAKTNDMASTTTPFVCYACTGETSRRSVAVETEDIGIETGELFNNALADLLTAGKPRTPGKGVQMHEKLLAQNRGR